MLLEYSMFSPDVLVPFIVADFGPCYEEQG